MERREYVDLLWILRTDPKYMRVKELREELNTHKAKYRGLVERCELAEKLREVRRQKGIVFAHDETEVQVHGETFDKEESKGILGASLGGGDGKSAVEIDLVRLFESIIGIPSSLAFALNVQIGVHTIKSILIRNARPLLLGAARQARLAEFMSKGAGGSTFKDPQHLDWAFTRGDFDDDEEDVDGGEGRLVGKGGANEKKRGGWMYDRAAATVGSSLVDGMRFAFRYRLLLRTTSHCARHPPCSSKGSEIL